MRPIGWTTEFNHLLGRYGARVAIADARGEISYRDLLRKAAGIAAALAEAGACPGEAVATTFTNDRDAAAAMFAVMMSGATEVPLNPALGAADRAHCLKVAGVRLVLTSDAVAPAETDARILTVDGIAPCDLDPRHECLCEPDSPARIVFTSGTTGRPKGAVHTQGSRWLANLLLRASLPHRPGPGSRVLLMTPFSHGTSLMTHAYLSSGASVALHDGVDPAVIWPLIESGRCDAMFAPPTVLAKIVDSAAGRRVDGLRTIFCGTAVLKPALYERAKAVFGPVIRVTYGKSEVFNPITVLEAAETEEWYRKGGGDACVGWPAAGVELAIRDDNDQPMPAGETGQVMIRAQHLMTGYATEKGFLPLPADGFHDTGDVGYIDADARLHLTGRLADMIKSGGYKVAPEEVERELAPALGASEVTVVGMPSDYWGEVVLAAVENPSAGWQESLAPIIETMTSYKRPRLLVPFERLPRNGIGKIMRGAIRADILSRYRFVDGPRPRLEPL